MAVTTVDARLPEGSDALPAPDVPRASIVVISAGHAAASSTARLGQAIGDAARDALTREGVAACVEHLEVRRFAGAVVRALVDSVREDVILDAMEAIQRADALVVVTPTVNASFSGLLKSFLDVLPPHALRSVPTAIAATGGTTRHTLVLDQAVRPMLGYQRAVVLPSCLYATADEWEGPRPSEELAARISAAGEELALFTRHRLHPAGSRDRWREE